ncbi:MAG: hypothetical protein ER33_02140 [Cyanobium sp. CACIAM 14]|nr:MAG: hypothetical protein ER33_02140 [Cyanobium sp. CACIAM 14]
MQGTPAAPAARCHWGKLPAVGTASASQPPRRQSVAPRGQLAGGIVEPLQGEPGDQQRCPP